MRQDTWPVVSNEKTYHLHHFWIIKVVDNVLKDVTVRHKAKSSEHNDDGDFLLYVRQDGYNALTNCTFTCTLKHTNAEYDMDKIRQLIHSVYYNADRYPVDLLHGTTIEHLPPKNN